MKTIVVGYDATDAAQRALERAAQLAEAFSSRLIVTSVAPVEAPGPRGMGPIDPTDSPQEHHAELVKAHEYLSGRNVAAEYQPAIGHEAESIVAVAEAMNADMIVVGTREPGMLARLMGTSVSESVQRHAHCDVLIVH
jgi:nucleotide-binding universal stress UspA family protein